MRLALPFVLVLVVLTTASAPTSARVGVGIIAGEPTGFCLKSWLGDTTAIDAATGWSLTGDESFYLHCDYLWHREVEDKEIGGRVPVHFGVGGRALFREGKDSKIGVRIPVGVNYIFENGRFDVFVELAPVLNIVPETEFDLTGGVGVRFYF